MKVVEATILIPLTILIIIGLIGLMMTFYDRLEKQTESHAEMRNEISEVEIDW